MESGVHMETVLKLIQRVDSRETDKKQEQEKRQLLEELREVARLMACNDLWFQLECDENLIEACIYQREALQARYGAAQRDQLRTVSTEEGRGISPWWACPFPCFTGSFWKRSDVRKRSPAAPSVPSSGPFSAV